MQQEVGHLLSGKGVRMRGELGESLATAVVETEKDVVEKGVDQTLGVMIVRESSGLQCFPTSFKR